MTRKWLYNVKWWKKAILASRVSRKISCLGTALHLLVGMTFYSTLSPYLHALCVSRSPQVEECLYSWLFTETRIQRASSGPSVLCLLIVGAVLVHVLFCPLCSAFQTPARRVNQSFSGSNFDNWKFWHQEQKNVKEHKIIPTKLYEPVRRWGLDFLHRGIQISQWIYSGTIAIPFTQCN